MKEVSIEFREEFRTVIDREISDEDYEAYCNGQKTISDIFGQEIYDEADRDFCAYGSDGIEDEIIYADEI